MAWVFVADIAAIFQDSTKRWREYKDRPIYSITCKLWRFIYNFMSYFTYSAVAHQLPFSNVAKCAAIDITKLKVTGSSLLELLLLMLLLLLRCYGGYSFVFNFGFNSLLFFFHAYCTSIYECFCLHFEYNRDRFSFFGCKKKESDYFTV